MFRRREGILLVLVLGSVVCLAATVGLPIKQGLFSADTNEQRMAIGTIRRQHAENVGLLIQLVGQKDVDDSWEGVRHLSIRLLGDMLATEAIPVLAERLTYLPTGPIVTEVLPREFYYPCAVALVNIGPPSVGAMIYTIHWNKDTTMRDLAAWVLMQIEGKEQAAQHMQDLADKSYDNRTKPRLQEAHDFIANYKPILSPPGVEPRPVKLLGRPETVDPK